LTFAIDFKFEDTAASVITSHHLWDSPLFNEKSGSALKFLENRGYADDAHGVKVFKEILRYLTFDAPWYFQSISGLNGMWKQATDMASGNKTKGTSLTIETLEAVDLRITELASIYRKAMFDKVHMREKVPDNLRWFAMDIYIAEARNLRYRLPGIGQNTAQLFGVNTAAIGNVLGGGNILSNVLEQYGYVKFRCRQCEFDFSDSFAGGSKLDVTTTNKPATNSFKINVGYFEEETRFADGSRIFDDLIRSEIENPWSLRNVGTDIKNAGSFLSGLPLIGDDIQRAGQKVQSAFAQVGGLLNPALGAASQFIDPPVKTLGNAYRR
jgi:predicted small secreted protein